jgi:hypothetical protein
METSASEDGEQRNHERFPIWRPVTITFGQDEASFGANLVDVSEGGAFVKLEKGPAFSAGQAIRLAAEPELANLDCRVVGVSSQWDGLYLHVSFEPMTDGERGALQTAVASLAEGSSDMLRWADSGRQWLEQIRTARIGWV